METLITKSTISAATLESERNYPHCGGVVSFEGKVRNHHHGKQVLRLNYEAYVPMAEKVLAKLTRDLEEEFPSCQILARHRYGELNIGDVAVAIVVWAPHRKEAFLACEKMINEIKKNVPIWKEEFYEDGTVAWVQCHHVH